MFPHNFTADDLPDAPQPVTHTILESYTDNIVNVFDTIILHLVHYRTGKLMLIRLFEVDTKSEIITSHAAKHDEGYR